MKPLLPLAEEVTLTMLAGSLLAAALAIGILIGYQAAPDPPSARYRVGSWADSDQRWDRVYRYDTHTGKTWRYSIGGLGSRTWTEIPERDQVAPP